MAEQNLNRPAPDTTARRCATCRAETEHVRRTRYERKGYGWTRRDAVAQEVIVCITCGSEREVMELP